MTGRDLAIPTVSARSLPATLAFRARLGFEGEIFGAQHDDAILARGDLEPHSFVHPEVVPAQAHVGRYLRVGDVDAPYRAFAAADLPRRGAPRMDAIGDKPWGMREFAVVDKHGSLLRIGQVI